MKSIVTICEKGDEAVSGFFISTGEKKTVNTESVSGGYIEIMPDTVKVFKQTGEGVGRELIKEIPYDIKDVFIVKTLEVKCIKPLETYMCMIVTTFQKGKETHEITYAF